MNDYNEMMYHVAIALIYFLFGNICMCHCYICLLGTLLHYCATHKYTFTVLFYKHTFAFVHVNLLHTYMH